MKCSTNAGGKETKTVFRCLQMSLRVHGIICFSRECMKHFNTFAAAFVCIQCVCVHINKLKSNIKNEHFRSVYILTIRINIDSCCARYLHTLSLDCNEFQCVRVREGEKKYRVSKCDVLQLSIQLFSFEARDCCSIFRTSYTQEMYTY